MSEFIIGGIILIIAVNWLYSRFCENPPSWPAVVKRKFLGSKRQEMARQIKGEPQSA